MRFGYRSQTPPNLNFQILFQGRAVPMMWTQTHTHTHTHTTHTHTHTHTPPHTHHTTHTHTHTHSLSHTLFHSPGVLLASCFGLCVSCYRWRLGVVMQLLELAYPDKSHAVPKMEDRKSTR